MRHLALDGGRTLDIRTSGPRHGTPLLFHHGTPGSRAPLRAFERAAHAHGFRYVTWSRPGYGRSSRAVGRAVVDVVPDVTAVLDHVGAPECVVAGWSGGGPHALAAAARLPDRVLAALTIASLAPYGPHDLNYFAGTGEPRVEERRAALGGEDTLRSVLEPEADDLRTSDARTIMHTFRTLLSPVDIEELTFEFGTDMAGQFSEALSRGIDGFVDDNLALVQPWGFELSEIAVPVVVWHGDQDLMVPFQHGQWLAANIPASTAHLEPDEGHLSLAVGTADRMLRDLRAALPS